MKRLLPIMLLLVLLLQACSTSKKLSPQMQKLSSQIAFEYVALTRGAYNKIIVSQDSIVTLKQRDLSGAIVKKTDEKDWNRVLMALEKVNLDSISLYKAPTNKRMADAALMANLKVFVNGKTHESTTFDHGYPPEQIKELTERIIAMSQLHKEKE
ncbi:hypothetical protein [Flavobacterium rhizosphaerae]|uniref:Lipoprotein n=1 Tax=Flavobacterium rhizosphaerae TaxID=3163298 RepID=A0ABW8Z0T2_9FLAO